MKAAIFAGTMQKVVAVVICLLAFSCREVSFREPQPRGKKSLEEIPPPLQGLYYIPPDGESPADTLRVNDSGYFFVSDRKDKMQLSDSVVIKRYKGYYFLNVHEKPEWLLRVIRPQPNGDLLMLSMETEEKKFQEFVRSLSKRIAVDSLKLETKTLYQIDPSPKELYKLIREGYFKQRILLKRIGN